MATKTTPKSVKVLGPAAPTTVTASFQLLVDGVVVPVRTYAGTEASKPPLREVVGTVAPAKAAEGHVKATTGRKVPAKQVYKVGTSSTGKLVRISAEEQTEATTVPEYVGPFPLTGIIGNDYLEDGWVPKDVSQLRFDDSEKTWGKLATEEQINIARRKFNALLAALYTRGESATLVYRPKADAPLVLAAINPLGQLVKFHWANEIRAQRELDHTVGGNDVEALEDFLGTLPSGVANVPTDPGAQALVDLIEAKARFKKNVVTLAEDEKLK